MKLEVHERLVLPNLLPAKEDWAALKAIRQAREMFSFTPEELKFYNLRNEKQPDGSTKVVWDVSRNAEQVKDCPITEYITDMIREKLLSMNANHELTEDYFSLYEKFVVMYNKQVKPK